MWQKLLIVHEDPPWFSHIKKFWRLLSTVVCRKLFSCPEQLNRWPCPLVAWSVTTNNQSLLNTTESTLSIVTFETFDQRDEKTWPDQKRSTYLPTFLPTSLHPYIREHHSRAYLSMTFSFLMHMGSGALLHILPLRHFIRVMRRHGLTNKFTYPPSYLPSYIPTLENTIQEHVCQWHFSCIWAAVLFYTFDIYRIHALLHLIRQIFVSHSWPSFSTLIFGPHFWPSFFTLIFDPNFWPSFFTLILTLIFYPHFVPSF